MYTGKAMSNLWESVSDTEDRINKLMAMLDMLADATTGGNVIDQETIGFYTQIMQRMTGELAEGHTKAFEALQQLRKELDTEDQKQIKKAQ